MLVVICLTGGMDNTYDTDQAYENSKLAVEFPNKTKQPFKEAECK
jgi:hypothetical protein